MSERQLGLEDEKERKEAKKDALCLHVLEDVNPTSAEGGISEHPEKNECDEENEDRSFMKAANEVTTLLDWA